MEMKPIRRIVTGHDAQGKAVALFDGPSMPRQRAASANASTLLWVTGESPVDMSGQTGSRRNAGRRPAPG